ATLFTILPSLICIIVVAKFLQKVQDNPYVKSAFSTIKPVVTGLIAVACWNVMEIALVKPGNIDWVSIIFFFISLALLTIKKMHPIAIVLLGAFFGIVFL
nr:chromate transporter [Treponemataceae bacterium]